MGDAVLELLKLSHVISLCSKEKDFWKANPSKNVQWSNNHWYKCLSKLPYIFREVSATWVHEDVVSLVEAEVAVVTDIGWLQPFSIHIRSSWGRLGLVERQADLRIGYPYYIFHPLYSCSWMHLAWLGYQPLRAQSLSHVVSQRKDL